MHGRAKEEAFVRVFAKEIASEHYLPLPFPFSPEDRVRGGTARKKYYLLHFSNHPKAALLMKEVMWSAKRDLEAILDGPQIRLLADDPDLQELRGLLLAKFRGKQLTFDDVRIQTLEWPCVEAHYRDVLKSMEGKDIIIQRVESKKTGLKGRDRVIFLQRPG